MHAFTVQAVLEKSTRLPNRFSIPTAYLPLTIFRTVPTFRNLIGVSFQRLATTAKLTITVLLVQFCSTVLKRQPCQSASFDTREFFLTQPSRIAQITLRLMKHTEYKAVFFPNKSSFKINVYHCKKRCVFGPQN